MYDYSRNVLLNSCSNTNYFSGLGKATSQSRTCVCVYKLQSTQLQTVTFELNNLSQIFGEIDAGILTTTSL